MTATLEVRNLRIQVASPNQSFTPVDGVSLSVEAGTALGIVGESGSGKTLTLKAIQGLLPREASRVGGDVLVEGQVVEYPRTHRKAKGTPGVAMVFQEPMAALNPMLRVEQLIGDAYRATHRVTKSAARSRVLSLMHEVGIPSPGDRLRAYPHQLSGGLRQRVMIAMALATEPRVLLCDEPTTALDVTVQQRILELIARIRDERGLAVVYVTHDLAVVGEVCQTVAVMYAGQVIETGPVEEVFNRPAHEYSHLLYQSTPRIETVADSLVTIPGSAPDPRHFPEGCRFHPRCPLAEDDCRMPARFTLHTIGVDRTTACIHANSVGSEPNGRHDGPTS